MEPIPMEWVINLFNCMHQFYGERWSKLFEKPHLEDIYKSIWQSGLTGLTYEQIKSALIEYKLQSKEKNTYPPHVMEFFRTAKK